VKLHPYYQDFIADEDRMLPYYNEVARLGLLLVMHTGYDIAFPRVRRADPTRIRRLTEQFPDLRLVTTHLGGWQQWDEVREHLLGRPIYMEVSYAMDDLPLAEARAMIVQHPGEYILFGTDSPWMDQSATLRWLLDMALPEDLLNHILAGNARELLGSSPCP
jgi:hypothetical protein